MEIKHSISRKSILVLAVLVISFLIYISRWSHPQLDDFLFLTLSRKLGFWGMQQWNYLHNSGRFVSSFVEALFARGDFMFYHYYVHSVLLILGTWFSLFWSAKRVFRALTGNTPSAMTRWLYTALFFMVYLETIPEISTSFYWLVSALTYQTGTILWILLPGLILESGSVSSHRKRGFFSLLTAFVLALLPGTDEVHALFTLTLLVPLILIGKNRGILSLKRAGLWISAFLVSLSFSLLAPGIRVRVHSIPHHGVLVSLMSAIFWMAGSWWFLLRIPVFWVLQADLFLAGGILKCQLIHPGFLPSRVSGRPWRVFLLVLFIEWLTLLPLLYALNGSFPLRALNIVSFANLILISWVSYWAGSRLPDLRNSPVYQAFRKIRYPLYLITILASPFLIQAIQTALSGSNYQAVYRKRVATIKSDLKAGIRSVHLESYRESLRRMGNKSNPERLLIRNLRDQKPALFHFESGTGVSQGYANWIPYFQLDSLCIGIKQVAIPKNLP